MKPDRATDFKADKYRAVCEKDLGESESLKRGNRKDISRLVSWAGATNNDAVKDAYWEDGTGTTLT